jgi:hypothetical protein
LALAAADEDAAIRAGEPHRDQFVDPEDRASTFWPELHERARWEKAKQTYEAAQYRLPTLKPFVDARSAGMLCFWVIETRRWSRRRCVAVPAPPSTSEQRLHRPTDQPSSAFRHLLLVLEGLHVLARRSAEQRSARLQVRSVPAT